MTSKLWARDVGRLKRKADKRKEEEWVVGRVRERLSVEKRKRMGVEKRDLNREREGGSVREGEWKRESMEQSGGERGKEIERDWKR